MNNDDVIQLSVVEITYLEDSSSPRSFVETIVTKDRRFLTEYEEKAKNWNLRIRFTENKDEGLYQCQIQSGTTSTAYVLLELEEAWAEIIDGPIKRINSEKVLPLRLSCVLKNSIEAPEYIFWYHEDRVINYDLGDNAHVREGDKGSELIFSKANRSHTGNYSCVPSNARQASVIVLYGDQPAPEDLLPNGECSRGNKRYFSRDHIFNILLLVSTSHLWR